MENQTRSCQNCKKEFTIPPEDFEHYEKIEVPAPTFCSNCRMQRRVLWRNEKTLYKRNCDATGKPIFSFVREGAPVKVFERSHWWGDSWDASNYAMDIDWDKPFLEQFKELLFKVPWPSRSAVNLVNSNYCMNCSDLKNCYLVFHASENEDSYYSVGLNNSKKCFDCMFTNGCELCFDCFNVTNSYKLISCSDCEDSQELIMSADCIGCSNCFGCYGLRNQKYHIFNEPYSKEDYFKKLEELGIGSHKNLQELRAQFKELALKQPNKYMKSKHVSDVSGEYIYRAKNVHDSYRVANMEDSRYCQNIVLVPGARDCYDYSFFGKDAELVYEGSSVGIGAANVKFSAYVYQSVQDIEYSVFCPSSKDLFGCSGMKSKQYCILNKQYTKEEYEELIPRIKQHMNDMPYIDSKGHTYKYGEFFPSEFSPFAYNETWTQEYFPLTKEAALEQGYQWKDPDVKNYDPDLKYSELPDTIEEVDDSITGKTILCASWAEDEKRAAEHNCSKAFKITPEELVFYRQMNIPLPRRCFNSRYFERSKQRSLVHLWERKCQCAGERSENNVYQNRSQSHQSHQVGEHCPNEFKTAYAPDRPEILYCEDCYQQEVV